jgi:transposase
MRLGDGDRALAKAGLIGQRKANEIRVLAGQHGWLDADKPLPDDAELNQALTRLDQPGPTSSVEPYQTLVLSWAQQGIQCKTIHQTLVRLHGFEGSYSAVHRFVSSLELKSPKATMRLDFAPGEAAQIDFGSGPELVDTRSGEIIKTHFFLMTLCWRRHQYAEIVLDQKVATWLECHGHAFEWLGGILGKFIIDNAKCAISGACRHDPVVQRAYSGCAEGYGFRIDALPPREPQMKGRVESGIKYLKRSFMPLREFRDLTDANRQQQDWILGEAGNRLHGTTHEQSLARFAIEQPLLNPLPAVPPELAEWAQVKVHRDCHVQFEKCLYSVPFKLIGQALWLKATAVTVRLYRDHELIAVHTRLHRPGSRSTLDDHLPPEAIAWKMRDPQWCLRQAEHIGAHGHQLIRLLFSDRVLDNLRAAQGVIRLKDKYGSVRLEAACERALSYNNPRYGAVKTILEKGLEQQPSAQLAFDTLADSYTGQGRFCRNTRNLLKH